MRQYDRLSRQHLSVEPLLHCAWLMVTVPWATLVGLSIGPCVTLWPVKTQRSTDLYQPGGLTLVLTNIRQTTVAYHPLTRTSPSLVFSLSLCDSHSLCFFAPLSVCELNLAMSVFRHFWPGMCISIMTSAQWLVMGLPTASTSSLCWNLHEPSLLSLYHSWQY